MHVFTYGTLLSPAVLNVVLGRVPGRVSGRLPDCARVPIQEQIYPAVVRCTGSVVDGMVCKDVTAEELVRLDAFEDPAYERCMLSVILEDGSSVVARVWMRADGDVEDLELSASWDFNQFQREHERDYLRRCAKWAEWFSETRATTKMEVK